MELIRGLHNLRPRHRGCVATIGAFDGVHLGHQAVLEHLQNKAEELQLQTQLSTKRTEVIAARQKLRAILLDPKSAGVDVDGLRAAIDLNALGEQYPRYGYLMLHSLLRAEGLVVNRKRTYRLYTELGMQVRAKRRKKLVRPRVPMALPTRPNER